MKNLTVLIMPLESIILPHYLLTNMKNCIPLLDMMNIHSVPLLVKNINNIKSQCIVFDVDSYCDIIHTHSITIQQIKCAISKLKLGNLTQLDCYHLIISRMEHICYYYVKRMQRNIISILIRLRVN